MKNIQFITLALITALLFSGCKDDESSSGEKTLYQIHLTDLPANYDAVYIDIQEVQVHTDANGWETLSTQAGIYDLLKLTNGIDTLVASDSLPVGVVSQIRFILGPNNSVVVDSVSYPLSTPSAEQSGLKLQVHQELVAGITYSILIDFDASRSIHQTGNGTYKLKPVLRTITQGIDGAIKGDLDPDGVAATVLAISGTDTFGTTVDSLGMFLIQGLAAGTYDVQIIPDTIYNQQTITGVSVTAGTVTDVGLINL